MRWTGRRFGKVGKAETEGDETHGVKRQVVERHHPCVGARPLRLAELERQHHRIG